MGQIFREETGKYNFSPLWCLSLIKLSPSCFTNMMASQIAFLVSFQSKENQPSYLSTASYPQLDQEILYRLLERATGPETEDICQSWFLLPTFAFTKHWQWSFFYPTTTNRKVNNIELIFVTHFFLSPNYSLLPNLVGIISIILEIVKRLVLWTVKILYFCNIL